MDHNVGTSVPICNIMDQDVALGITTTATQADIAPLRAAGRLGEYAVVYRAGRANQGGGFGDQGRHPLTWAVLVYVDGQAARIFSARGNGREWSSLDRLEKWLRDQGFWYWWTRNDLEPLGVAGEPDIEDLEDTATESLAQSPLAPGPTETPVPPPGPWSDWE